MKLYDDCFAPKETPEALEEGQKSHEGVTSPDADTTPLTMMFSRWWRSSRRSILPQEGCREEVFTRSRYRKRCSGGTMEKFAILDLLEGFWIGEVNIGQRRAPKEVGPTQAASSRG